MIDQRIKSAIRETTDQHGQPKSVAEKIIKWFENVANGNESLEDKDDYRRRLDNLFSAIDIESSEVDV